MSRGGLIATISGLGMLVAACGPTPPPAKPAVAPVGSDVIVLLPDPEDGRLGSAVVRAQGALGAPVDLAIARASTRVVPGQAPTVPVVMSEDDVQQRFGTVMSARPQPPREFLLYFQIASDDLTAESEAALPQIVLEIRNRPAPDISVIGHTDTTGSAATNATLGLRRATLIRDRLVAAGVPAAQIEASSHGEADLLVATPDNVAEARNRRVEVAVR